MIVRPANRIGEVKEYYFSRKLKEIRKLLAEGKPVLNLGIGSPDLAPADVVIDTLMDASKDPKNHGYQSYTGIPLLRSAFATWYKTWFDVDLDSNSEILPLMGSKEGIMHISMTFLEEGDEVLVPNPGYPAYAAVANLTGATIRHYNLTQQHHWLPNLQEIAQTDLTKVKIMWVNYPNMPTGKTANEKLFEDLVSFGLENRILICNDNPYAFILNDNPRSILQVERAKEVVLELNSLSKAHNMAGWRVGMLAGGEAYLSNILRFKTNMDSGMFKPVQLAAIQALQQPRSWYESLNNKYRERRLVVEQLLTVLDCSFDRNQVGMFVWAKIPPIHKDGFALSDLILKETNVFITPGGIFGSEGQSFVRVSLCNPVAVYEEALERIKKYYSAE